jgi:hypothetical protein
MELYTTPEAETAADHRAKLLVEYSTYVAAEPIDIDGVRAFNVGDPVPVSHVERYPQLLESGAVAKAPEPAADGTASGPPAKSAGRPEWAAYALTRGATQEEVAEGGLTRTELAAKYGG